MLSVKNLVKTYNVKGGAEVRALDDISVSFPETGLVFLLGKSGSGKSTLLNVAGGLDEPTSGEVIVMGKSSKSFTDSDFDSYRNTFVGFVFQEYNVLDEFTVEENVALALELQSKTKSHDKVMQILEEVELGGLAKRKPNTLSGGQKQRVAIARALVKDPQIIMADEPTGALDSATGKQVFELLKKLSKTRLVIVVSHDREFAEAYGDRIIELKDGKIISDVSRAHGNVTTAEKQDVILDEALFIKIRNFQSGENTFKDFLRANGLETEATGFETTPPQAVKEYDGKRINFIRSRLPLRKAVKIGASSLKLKPFRLVLTILLSVISFMLFGVMSTLMLFDERAVMVNTFMTSEYSSVLLSKGFEYREQNVAKGNEWMETNVRDARISHADVASFGNSAIGAYSLRSSVAVKNLYISQRSDYYYPSLTLAGVLENSHPLRNSITGTYPTNPNEICVSSYFLECLQHGSFYPIDEDGNQQSEAEKINSAHDLIGKRLLIGNSSFNDIFTVTGVFDSGIIPERFAKLKVGGDEDDFIYSALLNNYRRYVEESLHSLIFIDEGFYEKYSYNRDIIYSDNYLIDSNGYYEMPQSDYFDRVNYGDRYELFDETGINCGAYIERFRAYEANSTPSQAVTFLVNKSALAENEIIPSLSVIDNIVELHFQKTSHNEEEELAYQAYKEASNLVRSGYVQVKNDIEPFWFDSSVSYREATEEEMATAREVVFDYLKKVPLGVSMTNPITHQSFRCDIVAYHRDSSDSIYCSQNLYDSVEIYLARRVETKYVIPDDATFTLVLVPFSSRSALEKIAKSDRVFDHSTDVAFMIQNEVRVDIWEVSEFIKLLSNIFLYVGLGLALFACVLLFNLISVSITNKKKEIGILRAVGARGMDVFKIFFSEAGIIVGICVALAIIGSIVLTVILNKALREMIMLEVSLFVFGPLSVLFMLAIAVAVAVVSTYLPVNNAAKKKPVESIRAL
ncbi:MAG: ABC transporter ATP-binding protein/permease [Clostridiales bacterium]|nr:ABC transporter ATP-binding protein/permease [Clostridiales bacterium]